MKIKINSIHIYSLGFALVALLTIVFLVYPTLKDIKQNSDTILKNKSELVFTDEQSKAIEKFKDSYGNYEPNLKKIDQILIDPKNPIDIIEYLESSARESGVDLHVNLIESKKKENLYGLPMIIFNISADGTFDDLLHFSEQLEKGPYVIKIKNISMSKLLTNNKDNTISAQLVLYVATR